jgi:hypothetical protein
VLEKNSLQKTNKVVRISYSGGLLGLLFGNARGKLEKILTENNRDGWNLSQILPDDPNLIILVIRVFILILTLGLWTLSNGYLLILERPVTAEGSASNEGISADDSRQRPVLSASS